MGKSMNFIDLAGARAVGGRTRRAPRHGRRPVLPPAAARSDPHVAQDRLHRRAGRRAPVPRQVHRHLHHLQQAGPGNLPALHGADILGMQNARPAPTRPPPETHAPIRRQPQLDVHRASHGRNALPRPRATASPPWKSSRPTPGRRRTQGHPAAAAASSWCCSTRRRAARTWQASRSAWASSQKGTACLPGHEAEFRAGIAIALDYAQALGCPRIHVMAGILPAGMEREAVQPTYVNNLRRRRRRLAARVGVDPLIEPINTRDIPALLEPARPRA